MRIHPWFDPHKHVLDGAHRARMGFKLYQLLVRVDHNVRYPSLEAKSKKGPGFVVAVHGDSVRRKLCSEGDAQLVFACDVEREPFFIHPTGNAAGEKRLRGVVHIRR